MDNARGEFCGRVLLTLQPQAGLGECLLGWRVRKSDVAVEHESVEEM